MRNCRRTKLLFARTPAAAELGTAGGPEPASGPGRCGLEPSQKRRVAVVGRDRQRPGEPTADEDRVDEAVAEVDVGEEAAVDVAALDSEDEPHRAAFEQVVGEVGGPRPVALDRGARLDGLGRVDADQANVLRLAADPGLEG